MPKTNITFEIENHLQARDMMVLYELMCNPEDFDIGHRDDYCEAIGFLLERICDNLPDYFFDKNFAKYKFTKKIIEAKTLVFRARKI